MNRKDFIFGMNMHHYKYQSYPADTLERNIGFCEQMGVNFIQYNHPGINEEALECTKSVADAVHSKGMQFCLCVDDHSWKNMISEEVEEKKYLRTKGICEVLKGKVDVYNVGAEFDVPAMMANEGGMYNWVNKEREGMIYEEYNPERLERALFAVRGTIKAIREFDPKAKIMVTFSWWHTYYVEYLKEHGCKWDIMGVDWYSDAESKSDFIKLLDWIESKFGNMPVLISETNFWGPYWKDKTSEETEELQKEWVCSFTEHIYNDTPEHCLGLCIYELMDEPAIEIGNGSFHGEAHFGFYKCDAYGKNAIPKAVVNGFSDTIKKLKNN